MDYNPGPFELEVECLDCGNSYSVTYREGVLWPPECCGACGSVRIVVADEEQGNSTEGGQ